MEPTPSIDHRAPAPDLITRFIATGFFSGYVPKAPGTAGSFVAALFFLIPGFHQPIVLFPLTVLFFAIGGVTAGKMEQHLGQDPSIVTVDEVVGMWMSLWFVPFTLVNLAIAFIVFRVLDILKPYPAGVIDSRPGGWNIMLDDVIAALYTNFILQAAILLPRYL